MQSGRYDKYAEIFSVAKDRGSKGAPRYTRTSKGQAWMGEISILAREVLGGDEQQVNRTVWELDVHVDLNQSDEFDIEGVTYRVDSVVNKRTHLLVAATSQ